MHTNRALFTKSGHFFCKIRAFFSINKKRARKKEKKKPPTPSTLVVAHLLYGLIYEIG